MERTLYTREEEALVTMALASGEVPECPRCEVRMERRAVTPQEGVAYVRERVWLSCGACGRSVLVDRRRLGESAP